MKEVKGLYNKIDKTLMKVIEKDANKWKDIPHSCAGSITIVKMPILPKVSYKASAISIKIPMEFFTEIFLKIPKFIWNHKGSWIIKTILSRKNT